MWNAGGTGPGRSSALLVTGWYACCERCPVQAVATRKKSPRHDHLQPVMRLLPQLPEWIRAKFRRFQVTGIAK